MSPNASKFAALLLLAGLVPATALAHEFWLAPSSYVAAPGRPIRIAAFAGTGFRGEAKPWATPRAVRFVARTARDLDLTSIAENGSLDWAAFSPSDAGGALLAYESNFAFIELPANQFDAYLESEGLDQPLAARRHDHDSAPGRERYRRCPKAWLAGADESRATRPVGLPLEIVPLSAPGESPALRVHVLWGGKPLANSLVKAWRAPIGADGALSDPASRDSCAVLWQQRTDARGEVVVPVAAAGEWLVATVHMEPSRDRAAADWESTWASLTFERR
jgi:uncharacterized GH25 family protein